MRRFVVSASVVGVCLALLLPGASTYAASGGSAQDKAKAAAELDALKASDSQLLNAIADLDKAVSSQQAQVSAAQQSLDAANSAIVAADQSIEETLKRIAKLRETASSMAVDQYIRPRDDVLGYVLRSDGFADASRRSSLLTEVAARDAQTLDLLRAARLDLEREKKIALEARKTATARRAAEQAKLDQLNATRADKARLDESLKNRIADYAAEDDAAGGPGVSAAGGRASRGDSGGVDDGRVSAAGLIWPLHGTIQINSPFGPRWGRMHKGVDLQATTGTPIYAAKAGTITHAGWESGYGNYICIDHGGGFSTCYGHLSAVKVSNGQSVAQDQLIGLAGNTGASQGAHLHFETWVNGVARNPVQYMP